MSSPVGVSPGAVEARTDADGTPPGWHPCPSGDRRLRYWDGRRWTLHLFVFDPDAPRGHWTPGPATGWYLDPDPALRRYWDGHRWVDPSEPVPRPVRQPGPPSTRLVPSRLRPLMARLARYALVSVIATFTTLTVLGGLVATRALTAGWANVVAYVVGTVPSFVLNRHWVWRQTGRPMLSAELLPYALFNLISLAVSTLAVSYAGRWADHAGRTGTVRTLTVLAADLAVFGSLWLIQFALCQTLFRRPGEGR